MAEPPINLDELNKYNPAVLTKAQREAIITGQLTGQEQEKAEERAREFETRFEEFVVDLALLEYSDISPRNILLGPSIDTDLPIDTLLGPSIDTDVPIDTLLGPGIDTDLPIDTLLGDTYLMNKGFHTDFGAVLGYIYKMVFLPADLRPDDVVYGLLVGICGKEVDQHDTGKMESVLEDVEAEFSKRWAITDYHRLSDRLDQTSVEVEEVITQAGFEEPNDALKWILHVLVNRPAKREIHFDYNSHQTDSYPNLGQTGRDEYEKAMEWLKENTPVDIVPSVQTDVQHDIKEIRDRTWRGLDAKEALKILMEKETIKKDDFKNAIGADQQEQSTALLNSYSSVPGSKMELRTNTPLYRSLPNSEKYEIRSYGKLVYTCLHSDSEMDLLFYGAIRRNPTLWHALGQFKDIERHDTFPGLDTIQFTADVIRDYQKS